MKPRNTSNLLAVAAHFKPHLLSPELPKIPSKSHSSIIDPVSFTSNDTHKVLTQIFQKGVKYGKMKKTLSVDQLKDLQIRLLSSSYVKTMILKSMIKMGDERRLGAELRGFCKILLDQIEIQCWSMIQIELSLVKKQIEEQKQKNKLQQLIENASSHSNFITA